MGSGSIGLMVACILSYQIFSTINKLLTGKEDVMILYSIREYHVAPDGHQWGIRYYCNMLLSQAYEFIRNYTGNGSLSQPYED